MRLLALSALMAGVANCAGAVREAETPATAPAAQPAVSPAPRPHVVHIRGFQFAPKEFMVAPGDSVVWVNDDAVPHTATADSGSWRSPELPAGGSWGTRIRSPGVFEYHCGAHRVMRASLSAK